MQDFRYVGLDILSQAASTRRFSFLFFYPNWLIIRNFYLNLHKIQKSCQIYKNVSKKSEKLRQQTFLSYYGLNSLKKFLLKLQPRGLLFVI